MLTSKLAILSSRAFFSFTMRDSSYSSSLSSALRGAIEWKISEYVIKASNQTASGPAAFEAFMIFSVSNLSLFCKYSLEMKVFTLLGISSLLNSVTDLIKVSSLIFYFIVFQSAAFVDLVSKAMTGSRVFLTGSGGLG